MNSNNDIKDKLSIIAVIIGLLLLLSSCFGSDEDDYTCGYCGEEMGYYYDYIDGEYTCHSCSKALRD